MDKSKKHQQNLVASLSSFSSFHETTMFHQTIATQLRNNNPTADCLPSDSGCSSLCIITIYQALESGPLSLENWQAFYFFFWTPQCHPFSFYPSKRVVCVNYYNCQQRILRNFASREYCCCTEFDLLSSLTLYIYKLIYASALVWE